MIDKDGIDRPDNPDEIARPIINEKRKVKFDEHYNFRSRSLFFRFWSFCFIIFAKPILNLFIKIKWNYKIVGKQNYKALKKKAFVMTLNHVHICDDVSIGTNLCFGRKIYFTGLDRSFRRPMVGFWLRTLGGIPIPNSSLSGMRKFNDDISFLLKKKKPVLFNPESHMWLYYRDIRPFKRGAFVTAVKNDVPVLPLVLLFSAKKKRNGKLKYSLTLKVCQPIEKDKTLSEREQIDKLMNETYLVTKNTADEWYSQNRGFEN